MKKSDYILAFSFSASLLAFVSTGTVWAQGGDESAKAPATHSSNNGGLDDIIVTAQRRSQSLQDVPVAVSVVDGGVLAAQNLNSLEDVAARLPNVKITTGSLVNQITVRGVGSGQNAGFEQSVATFVDGVYRSRSMSSRAALFDITQVEVLKGPQTTFFGANAIAGALNIATRKPGNAFSYNASALYAFEDGEYNLEGGVDLPVNESLAVRVAGRVSGMDGYVHNSYLDEDGPHERTQQVRFSARWEPTAAIRSDLRVDYFRSRVDSAYPFVLTNCPVAAPLVEASSKSCGSYLAAGGKPFQSLGYESVSPSSFSNIKFWEGAWTNSIDIGGGALSTITGYLDQKVDSLTQPIPMPLPNAVGGVEGLPVYLGERFHQFSQEIRYQSATGGPVEYMFGGYYSDSHLYNYNYVGFFFLPFGAFNPSGSTDASTQITGSPRLTEDARTLSAFASLTIRPVGRLRINLGARYSNIRKKARRNVTLGTSEDALPSTYVPFTGDTLAFYSAVLGADLGQFAKPKRTDEKFMPSAGVQYDVTDDVMVYGTYSEGFKAGGYSAASLANDFAPETVKAYEVGLKGRFLDRRLTMNMALFRSDYSNLQESTIVISSAGTIISLVQNAAKSRSQGVELGSVLRVSPEFTLSADIAYLHSKYTSYPNGACTVLGNSLSTTCSQDLSGKRRPYAPKWSGNISANVAIPVSDDYRLFFDPVFYFSSKFFESATADPLLTQEGFSKIDLHLGFGPSDRRWQMSLIVKNLLDVATSGFRQQVTNSNAVYALPDRPRAIGVQFSIKN